MASVSSCAIIILASPSIYGGTVSHIGDDSNKGGKKTMTTIDLAVVGIAINAVSGIVLLLTAIIMMVQVREMRQATHATAFESVLGLLQNEDVRAARKTVFGLVNKPFESWIDSEKEAAEKVCYGYDVVGVMIRNGIIPVEVVADSWGDSLRRSWRILSPMVASYRAARSSDEYWDDYEWLSRQAEKFHKTS
jgi:hypothetical protein